MHDCTAVREVTGRGEWFASALMTQQMMTVAKMMIMAMRLVSARLPPQNTHTHTLHTLVSISRDCHIHWSPSSRNRQGKWMPGHLMQQAEGPATAETNHHPPASPARAEEIKDVNVNV